MLSNNTDEHEIVNLKLFIDGSEASTRGFGCWKFKFSVEAMYPIFFVKPSQHESPKLIQIRY